MKYLVVSNDGGARPQYSQVLDFQRIKRYRKHRVQRSFHKHTTNDGVFLEPDSNPLAHPLLHRLVSIQYRLLVDDDFCSVGFWPADSCSYCRRIRVHDDTAKRRRVTLARSSQGGGGRSKKGPLGAIFWIRGIGATHPSSIVSSKHNRTRSRFSKTALFSTWFRRSMCTASEKADRAALTISSFSSWLAIR